ncbi:MAG TPA: hypothetical protein VGO08_06285 [Burkholderiales bacterium]|jgi:hypothetical protein|nr:hypothetical protein [Burkholderiales bacterium]
MAHTGQTHPALRLLGVFVSLLIAAVPLASAQQPAPVRPPSLYQEGTAESIAERFSQLAENKRNRVTDEGPEVRIDAPDENATYTFTRQGHAAHPSLIRRAAGQRDNKVFIETTGITAADRTAFEKWFAVHLRQDDEIRARLRSK